MKEQEPGGGKEQEKLTREPNQNRLEREGDIFMPGPDSGGSGPEHGVPKPPESQQSVPENPVAPKPPRKPSAPRTPLSGAPQPPQEPQVAQEQIEATGPFWDAFAEKASHTPMSIDQRKKVEDYIARGRASGKPPEFESGNVGDNGEPKKPERGQPNIQQILDNETGQRRYSFEELLKDGAKRDEAFNNLFAGVDSTPHEFFDKAFNPLTYGRKYEDFMDFIRNASIGNIDEGTAAYMGEVELTDRDKIALREDFDRYQTERRVRQTLHDVNAILYLPSIKAKQLYESMQQFSSELGTFAWQTVGVKQMMDIYEASLRDDMMQHDGYLMPEAIIGKVSRGDNRVVSNVQQGEVERVTKQRFKEMMREGLIERRDENGKLEIIPAFKDWEIDRIFNLSRGMMVMDQRLLSLAAESRMAEDMGVYSSNFLQDVLQSYSAYIHLLGKYGITSEALAAYLYEEGEKKTGIGVLRRSNPAKLKEITALFVKGGADMEEILYNNQEMRYLMRENPNKAGDIFTWNSWRIVDNPDTVSMIQGFLKKGKMLREEQWDKDKPSAPKSAEYEAYITDSRTAVTKGLNDFRETVEYKNASPKKRDELLKQKRAAIEKKCREEWEKNHGVSETPTLSIEAYETYVGVHKDWIGTGVRFEKLRGKLAKIDKETANSIDEKHPRYKKLKEKEDRSKELTPEEKNLLDGVKAVKTAREIIGQMVKFQPHRLYLISERIRESINVGLTAEELPNVGQALRDLSLVETAILRDREYLIAKGIDFSKLNLSVPQFAHYFNETIFQKDPNTGEILNNPQGRPGIADMTRIEFAKKMVRLGNEDYANNKERYEDEFIFKREFKHGFVLWSGDAPIDEYDPGALGPTGSFARRARDNMGQADAMEKETAMLVGLREVKTAEDVIKLLTPVYDAIATYDSGKAKEAIADKLLGIAYLFGADTLVNVPGLGQLLELTGHASVAQFVWGKNAPVWHATQTRYLFTAARNMNIISQERYDKITQQGFASKFDVALDIGSAMTQLAALALAFYMMQELYKRKTS